MRTIWKYDIQIGECEIEIPVGAEILCAQIQHGRPQLWMHVDSEGEIEKRVLYNTETHTEKRYVLPLRDELEKLTAGSAVSAWETLSQSWSSWWNK